MVLLRSGKVVAVAAAVAVLFGLVTVLAGGRVLLGADPGYVVSRPLLWFNTVMGFAYVAVGILAWRRPAQGARGAAVVAVLNLAALATVGWLHLQGEAVASASLQAMVFRTAVWVVLFLVLLRAKAPSGEREGAGP